MDLHTPNDERRPFNDGGAVVQQRGCAGPTTTLRASIADGPHHHRRSAGVHRRYSATSTSNPQSPIGARQRFNGAAADSHRRISRPSSPKLHSCMGERQQSIRPSAASIRPAPAFNTEPSNAHRRTPAVRPPTPRVQPWRPGRQALTPDAHQRPLGAHPRTRRHRRAQTPPPRNVWSICSFDRQRGYMHPMAPGPIARLHAARAISRTRSSTAISSFTWGELNSPSGPRGVRSVKGDS